MVIYKKGTSDVCAIDFCCAKMAKKVLLREAEVDDWDTERLEWSIKKEYFQYCLYCGAKVQTLQAPQNVLDTKIEPWKESDA